MRVGRGIATTAWALALIVGASSARADGVCEKGFRDTTSAERATMTAVLEAAKKALPTAAEGWVIPGDDQVSVPTNICRDYELEPWRYQFTRYYQRVDDQEARDQAIKVAAANMQADMAWKQPRLDALMAKMQVLADEQIAAAQKGDYARVEAVNQQLAAVQADYQKVADEGNTAAQNSAIFEEVSRDREMSISVEVNSRVESPGSGASNLRLPAGARYAFRWSATRGDVKEDHALILLGSWKPAAGGGLQLAPRADLAPAAAHGISISVVADANRLAPTVDRIAFGNLAPPQ